MVLIPESSTRSRRCPVLAAGGIGSGRQMAAAMALGAEGVWTGSIWLTDRRVAIPAPVIQEKLLEATSTDTVRSRAMTGKPARMLRTAWTDAWEAPESPGHAADAAAVHPQLEGHARASPVGQRTRWPVMPVGQIVSRMNEVRTCRDVIFEMVEEYIETTDRMHKSTADA